MALANVKAPAAPEVTTDVLKRNPQPCIVADMAKGRLYIVSRSHKDTEWCLTNIKTGDTKYKPRPSFAALIDKAVEDGLVIKTYSSLDDIQAGIDMFIDGDFAD
jgi:hypothetical protein